MDEAPLQGRDHGLCSVFYIEPHENCAHVAFYSSFSDAKQVCDVPIAVAANQKMQDFQFAGTQIRVWDTRRQGSGNRRR